MARHTQIDLCLICGESPCDCHKGIYKSEKPAITRSPRKPKPASEPKPEASVEPAPAASKPPTALAMMKAKADEQTEAHKTDDQIFADAVTALAPILHPNERRKYGHLIDGRAGRLAAWKARVKR